MRNFWGGYVAFLTNPDVNEHYVLRDCSGRIPCYSVACEDVTVVMSNIEDLAGLALSSFSVNKEFLAGFIYDAEFANKDCALNEITELLAGECLEVTSRGVTQLPVWDPRMVCRVRSIENFDDAARQIRSTTQACIDLWASRYDRIVHLLSGGLDSSVVLGCLKDSPNSPTTTYLHYAMEGVGEDESRYARLAASAAGVKLIIEPGFSQDAKYDERIFRLPHTPKPSVANLGITLESDFRNLVPCRTRAEATWDGQGGDHLFFQSKGPFAAIDYAFVHGFRGDFTEHMMDAVRRSKLSYWGVLRRAMKSGILGMTWRPEDEYQRAATFVNPDIVPSHISDYVWQPWQSDALDLPPGKRLQICLLACLIHRHRPVPGIQYAAEHHPLFSQPLFELCLQIPIYTHLRGGTDRALERAAFRDCVPNPIVGRETKGSTSTSIMSKVRASLPFLRDLVLDGVLVRDRIIDRRAMEPFLSSNQPLNSRVLWPFLSCIAAEVWARKWESSHWHL